MIIIDIILSFIWKLLLPKNEQEQCLQAIIIKYRSHHDRDQKKHECFISQSCIKIIKLYELTKVNEGVICISKDFYYINVKRFKLINCNNILIIIEYHRIPCLFTFQQLNLFRFLSRITTRWILTTNNLQFRAVFCFFHTHIIYMQVSVHEWDSPVTQKNKLYIYIEILSHRLRLFKFKS